VESSSCGEVVAGDLFNDSRGVAWLVMLRVIDPCTTIEEDGSLGEYYCTKQIEKLSEKRNKYWELKQKYIPTASTQVGSMEDCNNSALWNNESDEIGDQIRKDLVRLFPNGCGEFFENSQIRVTMLHILYIWAQMNVSIGYRQGMHEVLAIVIFLLEGDSAHVEERFPLQFAF
jgi:hypothetical protein